MSVTPGLGAFNKDKVANKFGIQLKAKEVLQQPSTPLTAKKITTSKTSCVPKNKTISDFRTDNNVNGFLSNADLTSTSSISEATRKHSEKPRTNKPSSGPVNTSARHEQSHSLNTNTNHSTEKSTESLPVKPLEISKKKMITSTEQTVSPALPVKQASVLATNQKTEAQIQHQKDQPLYKRQLSKTLDNNSPPINKSTMAAAAATATTTTNALTTSLKR
ncbi:unnamed protein product [Rotaria magnacalcarata]|uniref:Uncharacterized protein n=3 Tax=Rotaria magnacalcarata TaxID=392030 RepID=A0A816KHL9_9BILA|nr:unnamed protein product [Rotaria magnacalcarata]CAF1640665.1 unnamed protein product [Rotaria magnacalcarata]CAF1907412.1 unnamed protein product [Rotaria magnacalcarata]CAF4073133.1 unnamed protein product [Rotaria magnacalcarata]CAF4099283.1 unnamed protein product [Rotaria magnacalcarata]